LYQLHIWNVVRFDFFTAVGFHITVFLHVKPCSLSVDTDVSEACLQITHSRYTAVLVTCLYNYHIFTLVISTLKTEATCLFETLLYINNTTYSVWHDLYLLLFFKHYMFRSSQSSSGVFIQNLKLKVKK
jgi:hypothetical protein